MLVLLATGAQSASRVAESDSTPPPVEAAALVYGPPVPPSVPKPEPIRVGGGGVSLRFYDPNAVLPAWDIDHPVWPLKLNQKFSRYHTGVDLDCNYREPIYAAREGTVVYAGWATGYGGMVRVDHPDGFQTLYGHASELLVRSGQQITRGQIIASCGSTGRSTGTHLHWEIIYNGQWLNPYGYVFHP